MKKILFFDTETTGLVNYKRPLNDIGQPRILQLAYSLKTEDGRVIEERNMLFSPLLFDGEQYDIPKESFDVHGIDTKFAVENGLKQSCAPSIFKEVAEKADVLVAHNIKFDISIMKTAHSRFIGSENPDYLSNDKIFCTMNNAIHLVKLPPTKKMFMYGMEGKYKRPSLAETYKHFFNEKIEGAHDAMVDVKACSKIFFQIKDVERKNEKENNVELEM